MAKKKVFLSFDYDNDLELKNAFVSQSKQPDSPFSINDFSLKEAHPDDESKMIAIFQGVTCPPKRSSVKNII